MIRPITCVCVLAAAASGLYLYQTKHVTRMIDRQIEQTMQMANAVREHSGMLRAEWAVLNDTSRLADLATRHLTLKQVQPAQFVTMAELDRRLPPIRSLSPSDAPQPDASPAAATPMAQVTPARPLTLVQASPATAQAPQPAPLVIASASPTAPATAMAPTTPPGARIAAASLPAPTPLLPPAPRAPEIRSVTAEARDLAPHDNATHDTAAHDTATHDAGARDAVTRETVAREPNRDGAPRELASREVSGREISAREGLPPMRPVITQAMATSAARRPATRLTPLEAAVPTVAPAVASVLGNSHALLPPPVPVQMPGGTLSRAP